MGTVSLSQILRDHYRWIPQSSRHTTTTTKIHSRSPHSHHQNGKKKNPKQNKTSQLIDRFAAQKETQACKK
jgi:hypothetical protein